MSSAQGTTYSSSAPPSIGLNYYDGRFLRAVDLNLEHQAQRAYVEYSNRAGGPGVVYGLDLTMAGTVFSVASGLGVDTPGRLVLLSSAQTGSVASLVPSGGAATTTPGSTSSSTTSGGAAGVAFDPCEDLPAELAVAIGGIYVVKIGWFQKLSGDAEVLGRLCDSGCADPTDRPYVVDGVRLWAEPVGNLTLVGLPGVTSTAVHVQSQVASAYFERERQQAGSLLSLRGLSLPTWSHGAAGDPLGEAGSPSEGLALGVFSWDGSQVVWFDPWIARRERMVPAPQQYWADLMELRPWSVFIAQVLQFQGQVAAGYPTLATALAAHGIAPGYAGGMAPAGSSARPAGPVSVGWIDGLANVIDALTTNGDAELRRIVVEGFGRVRSLQARLDAADAATGALAVSTRLFVDTGLTTIPAAGFVPSAAGTAAELAQEMRLLFGAGVDLRLCAVRRDQIAHELERAQHMDRISLIAGLADHAKVEPVDILVPDGIVETGGASQSAHTFALDIGLGATPPPSPGKLQQIAAADRSTILFTGAARVDTGSGVTAAAAVGGTDPGSLRGLASQIVGLIRRSADWVSTVDSLRGRSYGRSGVLINDLRRLGKAMLDSAVSYRKAARPTKFVNVQTDTNAVAMTATLTVSQDPFAMAVNSSASFRVEADVVLPGRATYGISIVADGLLLVIASGPSSLGTQVQVRVSGTATVTGTGITDPNGETQQFVRRLTLTLAGTGDEATLIVSDDAALSISLSWQGHPIEATGQAAANGTVAAQAQAVEDPTINQPGNEHRNAAIAAIQLVTGLHPKDPAYADDFYAQLIPDSGVSTQTVIRPVWDWVLFRRRRRHECAGATEVRAAGLSTVATWVLFARDLDQAATLRSQLQRGKTDGIPFGDTPTDLVEFDSGTATLRTSALAWRQRFDAAGGGSVVTFAGYARSQTSDDPPVGQQRAQALVNATSPSASLDPAGSVELVTDPPVGQMLSDTEGSIFLITYQPAPVADVIEVFAVNGLDRSSIPVAIDAGNQSAVERAPATAVMSVGRSESATLSADERATMSEGVDKMAAMSPAGASPPVRRAVGWIRRSIGADTRTALTSRLADLVDTLRVQPPADNPIDVDFGPADGPAARLYVIIEPAPSDGGGG